MLSSFKRLFAKPPPPLRIQDPDFGWITFVPGTSSTSSYWQMDGTWTVSTQSQGIRSSDIPGDESGPSETSREFFLERKKDLESIWTLAEPALRQLLEGWDSLEGSDPRASFHIASLNKDSDYSDGWEVCFETNDAHKWVYFCLQIQGNVVVTNTVDT